MSEAEPSMTSQYVPVVPTLIDSGITGMALLAMASYAIFVGSRGSLKANKSVESGGHGEGTAERMSQKDVLMAPIIGSCVLFGLFVLLKYLPKELVNFILSAYLLLMGMIALTLTMVPYMKKIVPSSVSNSKMHKLKFTIPYINLEFEHDWNQLDLICGVISLVIGVLHVVFDYWITLNLLGLAFCIQAIEFLSLGSFKNGVILLSLLFLYDIFWVFGTTVMVSVARNISAPIKLHFPRAITSWPWYDYSMLGLGDVVVPGIFVALMLRFDAKIQGATQSVVHNFRSPYFTAAMVAYAVSLVTTFIVMNVFKAAQPALLYLVPGELLAAFGTALYRGELRLLWNYSEEPEVKIEPLSIKTNDSVNETDSKNLDASSKIEQVQPVVTSAKPSVSPDASKRRKRID